MAMNPHICRKPQRVVSTLIAGLGLVCTLPLISGCGSGTVRSSGGAAVGRAALDDRVPVRSRVDTITTVDETTLYSFSVPSGNDIQPGAFFRVLDSENTNISKGTLQVLEITPDRMAAARLVGALFDPENPIGTDDPVRELALGGLLSGEDTERKVRKELQNENRVEAREQKEFAHLREDYQKRLVRLRNEFSEEHNKLKAAHAEQIARLEQRHSKALSAKDNERRADLATLKVELDRDFFHRFKQAERENNARARASEQSRLALQDRVDELLLLQQSHNAQVERLMKEADSAKSQIMIALFVLKLKLDKY